MDKNNLHFLEINEIKLDNVTLKISDDYDPILQSVDFSLPTDEVLLIESSNHDCPALFLKLLAGRAPLSAGQVLWNDESIFTTESAIDPRVNMGCYFEAFRAGVKDTFKSVLIADLGQDEFDFVIDYFDLAEVEQTPLKNLSYSYQKLAYLIKSAAANVSVSKQILVLEDPASGLQEQQWLCFLDFIQIQQRRGFLRHIFMTNHHPTAMRHLTHNKIFIEEGLIYFDEQVNLKKASHF
jgi:ABC-type multidrug transport system ATPase subunit